MGSRWSEEALHPGWVLWSLDCAALAMLPACSSLRLDVSADHVRRLGRLTQLRRLELVWASEHDVDAAKCAFERSELPP